MTQRKSSAAGHDMGKAARIKVYTEFKGSGLSNPLPKRTGKFAHIEGRQDLFDMGALELPPDGEADET